MRLRAGGRWERPAARQAKRASTGVASVSEPDQLWPRAREQGRWQAGQKRRQNRRRCA